MYDSTYPPSAPPMQTTEEITGPLVEAINAYAHGRTVTRVCLVHYAKDRSGAWLHNPWLLWFTEHHGHQLPAKMPVWMFERCYLKGPAPAWQVVPPAQGELF
jgi:hypothetical protein